MMRNKIVFSVICMVCVTSVAFSGVQTVKNIAFSLPGTFYYVNSQFMLDAGGTAILQTYDASESFYNYSIENVTLSISPCELKENRSSGGRAIGDFWGGGVLTATGDLRRTDPGTDLPSGDVLYSGTILVANMVKTSSEYWTLSETASISSIVTAAIGLTGDDGGLHSGIYFGGDGLVIGDMSLKLQFITPNISSFGTTNYQSSAVPVVQISAALPEPATLLLLSLGGLLISRKGK